MELEVDQFANGYLDVPLAAGIVVVAARVTHRGYSATCVRQVLWPATARCCTGKTEGENGQKKDFVPYLVFCKVGQFGPSGVILCSL